MKSEKIIDKTNKCHRLKDFIIESLSLYNTEKLEKIFLSVTSTERGHCSYPVNGRKYYKINCRLIDKKYPFIFKGFIRPIFIKKENITLVDYRFDEEVFENIEEEMAYIVGHELFHFLRHSKQINGRNTQSQANEFGFHFVRKFKNK